MSVERHVVTAFLRHAGKVLLVCRSDRVGSYRGRWSAISGYLETADPLEQAYREVEEETSIARTALALRARAQPLRIAAPELDTVWVVHPFLFDLARAPDVRLDWENRRAQWVTPAGLARLETVPALAEALQACLRQGADNAGNDDAG